MLFGTQKGELIIYDFKNNTANILEIGKLPIRLIKQIQDKQYIVYDGIQYVSVDVVAKTQQQIPINQDVEQLFLIYKQDDKQIVPGQLDNKGIITTFQAQKQFTLFKKQGDFIYKLSQDVKYKRIYKEFIITIDNNYNLQIYNLLIKKFQTFIFTNLDKQQQEKQQFKLKQQNNIQLKIIDNILIVQGDEQTILITLQSQFTKTYKNKKSSQIINKLLEIKQITPEQNLIFKQINRKINNINFFENYLLISENDQNNQQQSYLSFVDLKTNQQVKQLNFQSQIVDITIFDYSIFDSELSPFDQQNDKIKQSQIIITTKQYPSIIRRFTPFENKLCQIQQFINQELQNGNEFETDSESQLKLNQQNALRNGELINNLLINLLICLINKCFYQLSVEVFKTIIKYNDYIDYQKFIKFYVTMNAAQYIISLIPKPVDIISNTSNTTVPNSSQNHTKLSSTQHNFNGNAVDGFYIDKILEKQPSRASFSTQIQSTTQTTTQTTNQVSSNYNQINQDLYIQILLQVVDQDQKKLYELLKLWGTQWFEKRDLINRLEYIMEETQINYNKKETTSVFADPFKYIRLSLIYLYEQNKQYEKSYYLRKDINDQHFLIDYCCQHNLYETLFNDIKYYSDQQQTFNQVAEIILNAFNWQIGKFKKFIAFLSQIEDQNTLKSLSKVIQNTSAKNIEKLLNFLIFISQNQKLMNFKEISLYFVESRVELLCCILSDYDSEMQQNMQQNIQFSEQKCKIFIQIINLTFQAFNDFKEDIIIDDKYILQQMLQELDKCDQQCIQQYKQQIQDYIQQIRQFNQSGNQNYVNKSNQNKNNNDKLVHISIIKEKLLQNMCNIIQDQNIKEILNFYQQLYKIIEDKKNQIEIKNNLIDTLIDQQKYQRLAQTLNFLEEYQIQISNQQLQITICEIFDNQTDDKYINIIDLLNPVIASRIPNNLLLKTQYGIQLVNKLFIEDQMLTQCIDSINQSAKNEQHRYIQAKQQYCQTELFCKICQQTIDTQEQRYVTFLCGHTYHKKCLLQQTDKYGENVYVCPQCINEQELFQIGIKAYINKMN